MNKKCPTCGRNEADFRNWRTLCNSCIVEVMRDGGPAPNPALGLGLSAMPAPSVESAFDQGRLQSPVVVSASGARSSEHQPRFDLIPANGLRRLARRFELGAVKHGEDNWRKGLGDRDWLLERINHAHNHLHRLAASIKGPIFDVTDDDAAAVAWCGVVLCESPRLTTDPEE